MYASSSEVSAECRWSIDRHVDRQSDNHSRSTYRPTYRSSVSRHIDRCSTDMSADISSDTSRSTYRLTLDRYVDRHIGRYSADMSVVQSLNSPFFPPLVGAEPGRAKEESRITCMRMLRTPPFFPPKSGENPYLEVLFRFGLWRYFLHDNIQATTSAFRLIKNMSINSRSVEFHQRHAKPHSICCFFVYHIIKENERNLCQDLLTIENTDSDLKVHALHYANELPVRVRLSFQKLLQNRSTYRNNTKKMFGKTVVTRTPCR